jgi:MFS transporter, YNFM family, putative membrane transport protein
MKELASRYGRRRVIGFAIVFMPIGVLFTLPDRLWLTILRVGVVTFLGGHSITSNWVGLRTKTAKAQASALYLFFYYASIMRARCSRARSAAGLSPSPRGPERPP